MIKLKIGGRTELVIFLQFNCQISLMEHVKINTVFNTARFKYRCHDRLSVYLLTHTGERSAL